MSCIGQSLGTPYVDDAHDSYTRDSKTRVIGESSRGGWARDWVLHKAAAAAACFQIPNHKRRSSAGTSARARARAKGASKKAKILLTWIESPGEKSAARRGPSAASLPHSYVRNREPLSLLLHSRPPLTGQLILGVRRLRTYARSGLV